MFEFTDEIVKDVVSTYVEAVEAGVEYAGLRQIVAELAKEYKVSESRIQGKLVAEGVYVAKSAQKGEKGRTKEEIAKAFSAVTGKDMESLANAKLKALEELWDFFKQINGEIEIRAEEIARKASA